MSSASPYTYFDRANNIQMRITTSGMCDRQDKEGRGGQGYNSNTTRLHHFRYRHQRLLKPGPGAEVERGNFQSSWRLCGMNAMAHACVYIPRGRSSYMWTDIRPHRPRPHFEFPSFSLNHLRPLFHLLSRSEEDDDEQKVECGGV